MDWLNSLLGDEPSIPMMAGLFIALLVVLLIVFWLFRKIFGSSSGRLSKNRQPRLSVTDAAVVDDKRRLVLVRRDNVEHLLMIGGPSDIVVEQSIVRAAPVEVPASRMATALSPGQDPAPATLAPAVSSKPQSEDKGRFASKTETVGTAAVATGAGVVAAAESAGSSLTGIAGNAASSVGSVASNTTENVSNAASDIAASVSETVTSGVETAAAKASDIGSSLAADLDDALSSDNEPSASVEPQGTAPEIGSAHGGSQATKTEDEMQRLLDEISATKD